MPVATVTEFPRAFAAGDTVRVEISDADYPSSSWSLAVALRGAVVKSFDATAIPAEKYDLLIPSTETEKLTPGNYAVTFVYTSGGERISVPKGSVQVLNDPAKVGTKSVARQTLEAMEAAFLKLVQAPSGSRLSVNFVGQQFTNRNLKDFQDAIDRQQLLVDAEESEGDIESGNKRSTGIHIRF